MRNVLLQKPGQIAGKFVHYTKVESDHIAETTDANGIPLQTGFFSKGLWRHLALPRNQAIIRNRKNKTQRNLFPAVARLIFCFPSPIYLEYLHRAQVRPFTYTIPSYVKEKGRTTMAIMADDYDYSAMTTEELIALARKGDRKALKELFLRAKDGDDLAESEIILRAQRGDEDCFTFLIRHYKGYILKIIWNVFCNYGHKRKECCEDTSQDVLMRIVASLPNFEYRGPGSFQGWIGTISPRCAINHVHQCKPLESIDKPIGDTSGKKGILGPEVWSAILKALNSFTKEERIATILRLFFYLPQRVIAILMGVSLGKVNALLKSAFVKIREYLLKMGIDSTYFISHLSELSDPAPTSEEDSLVSSSSPPPDDLGNSILRTSKLWYAVLGCIDSLSEQEQWAVLSTWIVGNPVKDTAEILKLSVDEAADIIHNATKQTQLCLNQKGFAAASYGF
jgi:DNA-directed RNA polymerase specialized sigma24 family protein